MTAEGDILNLSKRDQRDIYSSQVILDAAAVVKELIENSIDAEATRIEVRVRGPAGLRSISVTDNGRGIRQDDLERLCNAHSTSKIRSIGDTTRLTTLGFRGEALSAIAALSGRLVVLTRTTDDKTGSAVQYSPLGKREKTEPAPRTVGTTVTVENLFASRPVRRTEAENNAKRELNRVVNTLQTYGLIHFGIKMTLAVESSTMIQTPGVSSFSPLRDDQGLYGAAAAIFGTKQVSMLAGVCKENLVLDPTEAQDVDDGAAEDANEEEGAKWSLYGLVSRAARESGRSASDRQFVYINSRPVDFPKLTRACNESFRRLVPTAQPFLILSLRASDTRIDVNLQPDKRMVTFREENELVRAVMRSLEDLWETHLSGIKVESQKQMDIRHVAVPAAGEASPPIAVDNARTILDTPEPATKVGRAGDRENNVFEEAAAVAIEAARDHSQATKPTPPLRNKPTTDLADEEPLARQKVTPPNNGDSLRAHGAATTNAAAAENSRRAARKRVLCDERRWTSLADFVARKQRASRRVSTRTSQAVDDIESDVRRNATTEAPGTKYSDKTAGATDSADVPAPKYDVPRLDTKPLKRSRASSSVGLTNDEQNRLGFGLRDVLDSMKVGKQATGAVRGDDVQAVYEKSSVRKQPSSEDEAEAELRKVFQKEWFREARVIGQFNLGFVVCEHRNDLFIVDQHAADEKHNFEDLYSTVELHMQPFVHPQTLDLSTEDELVVAEHLDSFRAGGFDMQFDPAGQPTRRVSLKSASYSFKTVFDQKDVQQMIADVRSIVQRGGEVPKVLRPKRVRDMIASRACRKSIMIGMALDANQMRRVLSALADLESPWNCPHGRPTMRHLWRLPS